MAKQDGDVNVIVHEGSGSFSRGRGGICAESTYGIVLIIKAGKI